MLHKNHRPSKLRAHTHFSGFTLLELLVVIAIVAILALLAVVGSTKVVRAARRAESMNNIKQFVSADALYFGDNQEFPPMDGMVPSSITRARLAIIADYLELPIPPGPVGSWPKRKDQPKWINCPLARISGYAEGPTMGGGVYTGYIYVGGIEESKMVKLRVATLLHPEHAADRRNTRRGVLWASILDEFNSGDPRRYESFHYNTLTAYKDFRFHESEVEGMHRGWSDGAVEWVPAKTIKFGTGPDRQIKHAYGFYYY